MKPLSLEEARYLERRIRRVTGGSHNNVLKLEGDKLAVTHSFYGRSLTAVTNWKQEFQGIKVTLRDHGPSKPERVFVKYELPPIEVLKKQLGRSNANKIDGALFLGFVRYAREMRKLGSKRLTEKIGALREASKELFKPVQ